MKLRTLKIRKDLARTESEARDRARGTPIGDWKPDPRMDPGTVIRTAARADRRRIAGDFRLDFSAGWWTVTIGNED